MLNDKKITIMYIDDNLDNNLSKYLSDIFTYNEYEIEQKQYSFDPEKDDTQTLIDLVQKEMPNIIIIDSALFENDKVKKEKVTGEKFKMILKGINPFIEVLVISQNATNIPEIIPKFALSLKDYDEFNKTYREHYKEKLAPKLESAIDEVISSIKIVNEYKDITTETTTIQNIHDLVSGDNTYSLLTNKDYDELMNAIKELISKYEDEWL